MKRNQHPVRMTPAEIREQQVVVSADVRFRAATAARRAVEIAVNGAPPEVISITGRDTPGPVAAFLDALLDLARWQAERKLPEAPAHVRRDAREELVAPMTRSNPEQFP